MTRTAGDTGTGPQRLIDGVVDLFLPRRCAECGATGAWLCPDCVARLRELTGPRCRRCGRPAPEPARGCIECRGRDLAFVSAAAAFSYEGPARSLVKACKFRKLRSVVADMAALAGPRFAQVCSAGGEQMPFDVVTWVPTTAGRRLDRGFDQAQVFARALAGGAGLAAAPLLQRTRAAGKQSDLDRVGRAGNVHGAFVCTHPAGPQVTAAGAHTTRPSRVLIIDDVYTTGETLYECATARSVEGYEPHVFTFARTVRGHPA